MAEDIDFKYPLKRACSSELSTHCEGIPHGDARLIRYKPPCANLKIWCLTFGRHEFVIGCDLLVKSWSCYCHEGICLVPCLVNHAAVLTMCSVANSIAASEELWGVASCWKGGFVSYVLSASQRCRCLQDHLEDDSMSSECKEEIQTDQIRSNQDYRYPAKLFCGSYENQRLQLPGWNGGPLVIQNRETKTSSRGWATDAIQAFSERSIATLWGPCFLDFGRWAQ